MSIVEEFEEIIKEGKIDELIIFLKHLSDEEKKILVPEINQLFVRLDSAEEILSRKFLLQSQYISKEEKERIRKSKVTDTVLYPSRLEYQKKLLYLAQFICFREEEDIKWIEKYTINLNDLYKYDVLSWYFPPLLAYDSYYTSRDYRLLLMSMDRYSKVFTIEEIIDSLVSTSFTNTQEIPQITLKEHIWYLFQYECEIHNHYLEGSAYWESKFLELLEENLIDKKRFFYETLLTTTRFTNRAIPNYFFRILDKVELSNKEILANQEELFSVLQNQHSKPITQTLKYIKQIHKEKSFNLTEFSSYIPTLLSWNIKTVVNNTLSLIDALIKAYPKERENLALLSLEVLASEDENIQIKLLKILNKHKLLESQTILEEIQLYADGLYHASKELLPNMDKIEIEESFEITPPQYIREDNKIPTYESFDDLVFFFSQVFEGKNAYDFDLFLVLLPKLHAGVNIHNVYKLSPLFLLAEKSYKKHDTSEDSNVLSHIISLMALTFIKYILRYQVIFHQDLQSLHEKHPYFKEKIETSVIFKAEEEERYKEATTIYSTLLLDMLDKLSCPRVILSTPTHTPCWIDIDILIERLKTYQLSSMTIEAYDIQIALARVVINNVNIQKIKNNLSGEIRDVLLYLCTNKSLVLSQIKNPHYWITPILRKNNSLDAEVFTQKFSKKTSLNLLSPPTWKVHIKELNYLELTLNKSIIYLKFISLFKRINQRPNALGSKYDSISLLFLTPTLTHFTLENELLFTYYDRDIFSVKAFIGLIPALSKIWDYPNQTSYLFLAYVFIHHHKTIRTLSSELWIKATIEGTMNHQLLGQTLGKLEHNEYAPLKRFTDLIVANMLNISSLHNRGLEVLLSSMIKQMNDEPIKGTKKLLEIYLEVLSLSKQKPSTELLDKLEVWGEVKSLKVIVKKIGEIRC